MTWRKKISAAQQRRLSSAECGEASGLFTELRKDPSSPELGRDHRLRVQKVKAGLRVISLSELCRLEGKSPPGFSRGATSAF